MVLINAIYFHGKWLTKFDESNTKNGEFLTESGSSVDVPMMSLEANLSHGYLEDVAVIVKVMQNLIVNLGIIWIRLLTFWQVCPHKELCQKMVLKSIEHLKQITK